MDYLLIRKCFYHYLFSLSSSDGEVALLSFVSSPTVFVSAHASSPFLFLSSIQTVSAVESTQDFFSGNQQTLDVHKRKREGLQELCVGQITLDSLWRFKKQNLFKFGSFKMFPFSLRPVLFFLF